MLVLKFPTVRARYDYHELSATHSIEVVPNELYYFDDKFNEWQRDTLVEFMDLFDEESLCFLTDNSIVGIDKVDFELCGQYYNVSDITVENAIFPVMYYPPLIYSRLDKELLSAFKPLDFKFIDTMIPSANFNQNSLEEITIFDRMNGHLMSEPQQEGPWGHLVLENNQTAFKETDKNEFAQAA